MSPRHNDESHSLNQPVRSVHLDAAHARNHHCPARRSSSKPVARSSNRTVSAPLSKPPRGAHMLTLMPPTRNVRNCPKQSGQEAAGTPDLWLLHPAMRVHHTVAHGQANHEVADYQRHGAEQQVRKDVHSETLGAYVLTGPQRKRLGTSPPALSGRDRARASTTPWPTSPPYQIVKVAPGSTTSVSTDRLPRNRGVAPGRSRRRSEGESGARLGGAKRSGHVGRQGVDGDARCGE